VSRAFTKEGEGWDDPSYRVSLPPRDDPGFDAAAADALLEAARDGKTGSAEAATGYYWGEPKLRPFVQQALDRALKSGDERLAQVARRYLSVSA
jgi:hypothetical protein